jgi:hypothetical protein
MAPEAPSARDSHLKVDQVTVEHCGSFLPPSVMVSDYARSSCALLRSLPFVLLVLPKEPQILVLYWLARKFITEAFVFLLFAH